GPGGGRTGPAGARRGPGGQGGGARGGPGAGPRGRLPGRFEDQDARGVVPQGHCRAPRGRGPVTSGPDDAILADGGPPEDAPRPGADACPGGATPRQASRIDEPPRRATPPERFLALVFASTLR